MEIFDEDFEDGWRMIPVAGGVTYENIYGERIPQTFGKNSCGFMNGFASVELQDGRYSFLNAKGELLKGSFMRVFPFNKCGLALVEIEDQPYALVTDKGTKVKMKSFVYINRKGKVVSPKLAGATDYFRGGLARVMFKDGMFGYIRDDGKLLPRKFKYGGEVFAAISKTYLNNGEIFITMGDDPPVSPLVRRLLELEFGQGTRRYETLLSQFFSCNSLNFSREAEVQALLSKLNRHVNEIKTIPFTYARVGLLRGDVIRYVDYNGRIWERGMKSHTLRCVDDCTEDEKGL